MLKEEFIKRAQIIHGNDYDYTFVPENFSTKDKVKLKCNKCNHLFMSRVETHIRGTGCNKCSHLKPFEEFVEQANAIHKNLYIYNKNDYYNRCNNTKIKIYCTKCHNYFFQTTNSHLQGKGCNVCSKSRHLTADEFFTKIKNIFGNIYDYSKAIYRDSNHKIKLYCKHCDIWFERSTTALLKGKGCPYCQKGTSDTYKIFVEKAKNVHGDKYDYDKQTFNLSNSKVKIYCKKCKRWFWQVKSAHISGKGCLICAGKERKTTKKFIEEAKLIHGNKYDYSKTKYVRAWDKVIIFCNKCHKYFNMRARLHLDGQGCPNCMPISKGEDKIKELLTNYKIKFEQQKIFQGCKYKKPLRFDFYLSDYNCCIEYQGEQHYKSDFYKRWNLGEDEFKATLLRDEIKRNYCKENNIKLYEIRYTENIEIQLKKILSEYKINFVE